MEPEKLSEEFWRTFLSAAETEPRTGRQISGASGLEHQMLAIGVDDARKRIVVVSPEADGRSAALVQSDIQATLPDVHVILARPVTIRLAPIASAFIEALGRQEAPLAAVAKLFKRKKMKVRVEELLSEVGPTFKVFPPSTVIGVLPMLMQLVKQLSLLNVTSLRAPTPTGGAAVTDITVDFSKLAGDDPIQADRDLGVCPLPLYEFGDTDAEQFVRGGGVEVARDVLKRMGVHQFFFPPSDQLTLAVIDRGEHERVRVPQVVGLAPTIGHPLSAPELLAPDTPLPDIIDALQERGLLVEGEETLVVTPQGEEVRRTVKYRSRESAVSKLLNRVNLTIGTNQTFGD